MVGRMLIAVIFVLASISCFAAAPFDTQTASKTVVFIYAAGSDGHVDPLRPLGTGFLMEVPIRAGGGMVFLVTARHIVDPEWTLCPEMKNPQKLFIRVNKKSYDPDKDASGVAYLPVPLFRNGNRLYYVNSDEQADIAVVGFTDEAFPRNDASLYDVVFMDFNMLPSDEELRQFVVGDPISSLGLVPGVSGDKRNYPFFKFGNISSIPDEPFRGITCPTNVLSGRQERVWFLATNLVGGNSGSPILYYPYLFASAVKRVVILGVQSSSLMIADIAGIAPAHYLIEIFEQMKIPDANLYRGDLPKTSTQPPNSSPPPKQS